MARSLRLVLCLVAASLAPGAALAGESPSPAGHEPLPASSLYHDWLSGWSRAATGDQVRYGLDPETGEWGYVAIPDPLATLGLSSEPLVIHHANGMIEVIMPPGMADYLVARVGPDGRIAIGCSTHPDPDHALTAPRRAAPDR